MQLSFWIWLAVAVVGTASTWPRVQSTKASRVFEPNEPCVERLAKRDFRAFNALIWPLGFAVLGAALELSDAAFFQTHRGAWWSWTAGLGFASLLVGALSILNVPGERAARLGLAAVGAVMALFAVIQTPLLEPIALLSAFAAAWVLAREDDDSLLVALACVAVILAIWRETRAPGESWNEAAGLAILIAIAMLWGAAFPARLRVVWSAIAAGVGAGALVGIGENGAAFVWVGGALGGAVLTWHARESVDAKTETWVPLAFVLALALGANAVLQGLGVALGTLAACAVLGAWGERIWAARVAALGAILGICRLLEARESTFGSVPLSDFSVLWALVATAALILAASSMRAPRWNLLVLPALIWLGMAALLFVWGPRAALGALAGCVAALVFGPHSCARGAILGALFLSVWLWIGTAFVDEPRIARLTVLGGMAVLGALLSLSWKRMRSAR